MKVIIQIPCFNEETTLGITLRDLPRQLPGIDSVEWLVIDDGSDDETAEVARACGADHIVLLHRRCGLATAFLKGIDTALAAGADIVVNTDGDNQYSADDIPRLLAPILNGEAEIVIGSRPTWDNPDFSLVKKLLQVVGSAFVRIVSGTEVVDATSGFRALSREAALKLNILGKYTHTLETIIFAGYQGISILSVPVRVNPSLRPSRLMRGPTEYVWRSVINIIRILLTYRPLVFCVTLGIAPFLLGILLGMRAILRAGECTSTIAIGLVGCFLATLQFWIAGVLANLSAVNRRHLEEIRFQIRKNVLDQASSLSLKE